MHRRDLLKILPLGFAATCLPLGRRASAVTSAPLLSALTNTSAETDRVAVIIWLGGGNDGLNTVVPFEDPLYDANRKKTGFSTTEDKQMLVHKLRDDLALNPAMDAAWPLWQEGKIAIVQNVGLRNADLSHFRATDIWNSASDPEVLEPTGWIARWLELDNPRYPEVLPRDPLAISMGVYSSSIFHGSRGQMDILLADPRDYRSTDSLGDSAILPTYGGREAKFVSDLISISDTYSKRFGELFPKYAQNTVEYPDTPIGQDLRAISWCIQSGLKTRVYYTQEFGFDTHYYENTKDATQEGHAFHLKNVFDAVAAFQKDLEQLGLADRVLTMTYSEFGRRISENGAFDSGTDHGTCAPQFIIGTQVNGELYGTHPDLEHLDAAGDPFNEFEFRSIYASVLGDWFGVSKETAHAILTPRAAHDPFATEFPINGQAVRQSLIKQRASNVAGERSRTALNARCFPNPCTDSTTLRFDLAGAQNVSVELFDGSAKLLWNVPVRKFSAGMHEIPLSLAALPTGRYFYRLTVGDITTSGEILKVR